MSDLVGNPEDRFSRVAAQIELIEIAVYFVYISSQYRLFELKPIPLHVSIPTVNGQFNHVVVELSSN